MKKFTNTDTLSMLFAIITYIMIGPFISNISSYTYNFFSKEGFSILSLFGLLPLIFMYFIYSYGYKKQMELLSSEKFKTILEKQRKNMLNNSVFLFDSKDNIEKKYYANVDEFAKRLIPVGLLILFVSFYTNRNLIPLSNYASIETLGFYIGLIVVIITFLPKQSHKTPVTDSN